MTRAFADTSARSHSAGPQDRGGCHRVRSRDERASLQPRQRLHRDGMRGPALAEASRRLVIVASRAPRFAGAREEHRRISPRSPEGSVRSVAPSECGDRSERAKQAPQFGKLCDRAVRYWRRENQIGEMPCNNPRNRLLASISLIFGQRRSKSAQIFLGIVRPAAACACGCPSAPESGRWRPCPRRRARWLAPRRRWRAWS